jgi:hypothetical protein
MSVITNTSVGAGVNTSSRDNHNVIFPTRDGGNKSHVITVDAQPIVVRSAEYPGGIAAKFQITPDGGRTWADWKVHGQQVLVSANNPFQWVSFSGQYRFVLIDEATGAEYAGQAQPLITFFASTQTHEHQWPLVPIKVDAPIVPPIPTTVTTRLIANPGGTFSLVVGVNGVEALPLLLPSSAAPPTTVENTLVNLCATGGDLTLRTTVNGVQSAPVTFPCPSSVVPPTTVALTAEDFCYAVGIVNLKATVNGVDSNTVGIPCPRF